MVVLRLEDDYILFLLILAKIELVTFLWKTCFMEEFKKIIIGKDGGSGEDVKIRIAKAQGVFVHSWKKFGRIEW